MHLVERGTELSAAPAEALARAAAPLNRKETMRRLDTVRSMVDLGSFADESHAAIAKQRKLALLRSRSARNGSSASLSAEAALGGFMRGSSMRGGSGESQLVLNEQTEGVLKQRRGEVAHAKRLRQLREPRRQKYWGDGAKRALFDLFKVANRASEDERELKASAYVCSIASIAFTNAAPF